MDIKDINVIRKQYSDELKKNSSKPIDIYSCIKQFKPITELETDLTNSLDSSDSSVKTNIVNSNSKSSKSNIERFLKIKKNN